MYMYYITYRLWSIHLVTASCQGGWRRGSSKSNSVRIKFLYKLFRCSKSGGSGAKWALLSELRFLKPTSKHLTLDIQYWGVLNCTTCDICVIKIITFWPAKLPKTVSHGLPTSALISQRDPGFFLHQLIHPPCERNAIKNVGGFNINALWITKCHICWISRKWVIVLY